MPGIIRLKNSIQEYAWGSKTAIAELLGQQIPSKKPQAELWMGTHPKSPSFALIDEQHISLIDLIKKDPVAILGKETFEKFSGELPFLFKVLAAAKPLSIQAHPTIQQAKEGFEIENRKKIPINAYERSYKDKNHKPEIFSALTPFWAMSGFRPVEQIISILKLIPFKSIEKEIKIFQESPDQDGLKRFFKSLMTLSDERKKKAIEDTVQWANKPSKKSDTEYIDIKNWIVKISKEYPQDIGILSPILLNLVCLNPGEAMFNPAGVLHAYLEGTGIELMANSDNVLRGGLTNKYIDIQELLNIVDYTSTEFQNVPLINLSNAEVVYDSPAREFKLSKIEITTKTKYINAYRKSVEIMICMEGFCSVFETETERSIELKKGDSVLVPAAVKSYEISGSALLFKASVP